MKNERLSLAVTIISVLVVAITPSFSQTTAAGQNGAVASVHKLASEVGINILEAGGNAIDAAIAVHMALAVVHPQAGNIGGGGFFVIHLAETKSNTTIDFRETAPLRGHEKMYQDKDGNIIAGISRTGHLAVGVPGSIAGLWLAHQKYGSLPWKVLLEPAFRLANEGFEVDYFLASSLQASASRLARFPETAAIFLNGGKAWQFGERLVQKDLANSIKIIMEQGRDGFYTGEIAEKIARTMQKNGGLVDLESITAYQAKERKPIVGSYRGYKVVSMPPPSSGGVLLVQMLNMLEHFDIGSLGHNSAEYIQLLTEIEKLAYADRATHLGDSDFYPVPIETLISEEYARQRMWSINRYRATPSEKIASGRIQYESEETTHFSVIDKNGNAVSCTTTLNGSFGSAVVADGTGILLNNEMDDFSTKPGYPNMYGLIGGKANAIEPGKRMLSSMTPTILLDEHDTVHMITGSPGGSTIITTTLQTILNVIDHHLPVAQAVYAPRFHHQWLPDVTYYERFGFSMDTLRQLGLMGHNLIERSGIGDVHAIVREPETGIYLAASDPRRGGSAESY